MRVRSGFGICMMFLGCGNLGAASYILGITFAGSWPPGQDGLQITMMRTGKIYTIKASWFVFSGVLRSLTADTRLYSPSLIPNSFEFPVLGNEVGRKFQINCRNLYAAGHDGVIGEVRLQIGVKIDKVHSAEEGWGCITLP